MYFLVISMATEMCIRDRPYRTLDFRFETHPVDFWQSHGTVNYTVDQDYTRITEFKYLTGQELPGQTDVYKRQRPAFGYESIW